MTLWQKIKRCSAGFVEDEAPQSAAAISFYAVTSLPPLIVLFISCAGLLVNDEAFQGYLIGQVGQLFGPSGAEVVSIIIVQSAQSRHGLAALIGLVTLLITSGGLHAQLQTSLNKMWNIRRRKQQMWRQFMGDRLLGIVTIAMTGIVLVASLLISTVFRATSSWVEQQFSISLISIERTQTLTSFLLLTVMVALLFKVLPAARVAWRDVWRGAFLTSFLFAVARQLIALYLSSASLSVSYGQAGTLVLLLLWVYVTALIFLFGAEWTSIEAELGGRHIVARSLPLIVELTRDMGDYPQTRFDTPLPEPEHN